MCCVYTHALCLDLNLESRFAHTIVTKISHKIVYNTKLLLHLLGDNIYIPNSHMSLYYSLIKVRSVTVHKTYFVQQIFLLLNIEFNQLNNSIFQTTRSASPHINIFSGSRS